MGVNGKANLCYEQYKRAAEPPHEGSKEHHLYAVGEDSEQPGGAEGRRSNQQDPAAAELHGHAAQQAAAQRPQQGQRRHPRLLLGADGEARRPSRRWRRRRRLRGGWRAVAGAPAGRLLLQGRDGRRAVAFPQPGGERAQ